MDLNENGEDNISIPPDLLIEEYKSPLFFLVNFVLSWSLQNIMNPGLFDDNAILFHILESIE